MIENHYSDKYVSGLHNRLKKMEERAHDEAPCPIMLDLKVAVVTLSEALNAILDITENCTVDSKETIQEIAHHALRKSLT